MASWHIFTSEAIIAAAIGAVITAAATIASPLVPTIYEQYLDPKYKTISRDRAEKLDGVWSGDFNQLINGQTQIVKLTLNLNIKGKQVVGTLSFLSPIDKAQQSFDITGGFLFDRFARLDYDSKDKGQEYFGSIVVELDSMATQMVGSFVAYGAYTKRIVTGTIKLKKV